MKIAEIYKSVQGEGRLTGTPSVFVRASGCNLRCWFCDTPYASWQPEGEDYAVDEIIAEIEEWECEHVVITGGEPMLFAELIPLCDELQRQGRHTTIETAGTLYLPAACDLMSISPKLSTSAPSVAEHPRWSRRHERARRQVSVVGRLIAERDSQLKFVVDVPADLAEIETWLVELPAIKGDRVLLMPQGRTAEEVAQRKTWVEAECRLRGWTYCPRRQLQWFGPVRRTCQSFTFSWAAVSRPACAMFAWRRRRGLATFASSSRRRRLAAPWIGAAEPARGQGHGSARLWAQTPAP
jgi:7-carboxy-7-deazaguanine synthase